MKRGLIIRTNHIELIAFSDMVFSIKKFEFLIK